MALQSVVVINEITHAAYPILQHMSQQYIDLGMSHLSKVICRTARSKITLYNHLVVYLKFAKPMRVALPAKK